jgi:transcriptional regulator with XRE-family HTH domain
MPKAFLTPRHAEFLKLVGDDIRKLRLKADVSQETLGDHLGWNKDAISKIERGINSLTLYDYMRLMLFLRDLAPSHASLRLANRYGLLK